MRVPGRYRLPLVATIVVLVGLLPMPGEYYVLMPLFLSGSCVYYLSTAVRVPEWEKFVLIGLIVLHNPIMPVPIGDRVFWSVANVATAAYFWLLASRGPRPLGLW